MAVKDAPEMAEDTPTASPVSAEELNRSCSCRTLDSELLRHHLESDPQLTGLYEDIRRERPSLFSATSVFLSQAQWQSMADTVAAIERVVQSPNYQQAVLAQAPAIARHEFGPCGVFMGYDFHLGPAGPRLIEINTNAGGPLLNLVLARAQYACCQAMGSAMSPMMRARLPEPDYGAMMRREWSRQRAGTPLGRIAIVDDDPAQQYLLPEFRLFERLFQALGIPAVVADPAELTLRGGTLHHASGVVDMVYNRLTDFYLDEPRHAVLREAYTTGAVVLTPHPRAHALYANKHNLVRLSDPDQLIAWGVEAAVREQILAGVPRTVAVHRTHADSLWERRRQLFFKPAWGYGSKAAYRGDKLTRRVWDDILSSDYVAQDLVPPSERIVEVEGSDAGLKFDVRAYVYAGQIQLLAARLYSGQTTNFRTQGGGFAPVFVVP